MRGVETDATHPSAEGLGGEIDQLLAGLERLRPELGPLAEELIGLLRGIESAQGGGSGAGEKD